VSKKILLIGGSGLLGLNWKFYDTQNTVISTFSRRLPNIFDDWHQFTYNGFNHLDLKNLIIAINPHVIINCAALANVEKCEENKIVSTIVNSNLPKILAIICKEINCKFVQISTDHFDSEIKVPRSEEIGVVPINAYGQTKFSGEKFVLNANQNALIIRVNFFGFGTIGNPSLLDKILDHFEHGKTFFGFKDIFFTPISIKKLVTNVHKLLQVNQSGIFNLASSNVITKYNFAQAVSDVFELDSKFLKPADSSSVSYRSARPKYLALDATKFSYLTDTMNVSVDQMLSELKNDIDWRKKLRTVNV
jgi:dTDP-4-dehydrorhamnose reductase